MGWFEKSLSGFKVSGDEIEVVEHSEYIVRALRDLSDAVVGVSLSVIEVFDERRRKAHERLHEDNNKKTVQNVSLNPGRGIEPEEDIQVLGEKLVKSYENLNEPDEAVDKWYVSRVVDATSRNALRAVEGMVYRNVMPQIVPYYFETRTLQC